MRRVTSVNIATEVAKEYGISPALMNELTRAFLAKCGQALLNGDELMLFTLGRMYVKKQKRPSKVIKGGRVIHCTAHSKVYFKKSAVLSGLLKNALLTPQERGKIMPDNEKEMSKYGVDESRKDTEKQAAKGCPQCGMRSERLIKHGHLVICPRCGTEPFE